MHDSFSKGIQGAQGRSTSLHTSGPLALVPRQQIACYLQGRPSRMGRYDANLLDSKPTRANSKRTNIAPKQSSTMLTKTLEQTFYRGMHALSTAGDSQTVWLFQQGTKSFPSAVWVFAWQVVLDLPAETRSATTISAVENNGLRTFYTPEAH